VKQFLGYPAGYKILIPTIPRNTCSEIEDQTKEAQCMSELALEVIESGVRKRDEGIATPRELSGFEKRSRKARRTVLQVTEKCPALLP
jgi:hypothetical protein